MVSASDWRTNCTVQASKKQAATTSTSDDSALNASYPVWALSSGWPANNGTYDVMTLFSGKHPRS